MKQRSVALQNTLHHPKPDTVSYPLSNANGILNRSVAAARLAEIRERQQRHEPLGQFEPKKVSEIT